MAIDAADYHDLIQWKQAKKKQYVLFVVDGNEEVLFRTICDTPEETLGKLAAYERYLKKVDQNIIS